jgi:hypothetical protein
MSKKLQPWAYASQGMLVCANGSAAAAGAAVLASGGSALEATLAAALAACEPEVQAMPVTALVRMPGRPPAALSAARAAGPELHSLLADPQSGWEAPASMTYQEFTVLAAGEHGRAVLEHLAKGRGAAPAATSAHDEAVSHRFIACDADGAVAALAFGRCAPVLLLQHGIPVCLLSATETADCLATLAALVDRRLPLQAALTAGSPFGSTYAVQLVGGPGPGFAGGSCGRQPAAVVGLSGGPAHIAPGINFFVTPI